MKIGFIGAGKMAEAIISAVIRSGQAGAHEVFASDVDEDRRAEIKRVYGINAYSKNAAVVTAVRVLVLAVKPQNLDDVLVEIAPDITPEHLVISIAAGKQTADIEAHLAAARVARVMPNLPATVGEGMSVFCVGRHASELDRETVRRLLSSFGRVLDLPEEDFDTVTAMSGSGPAFFAHFLNCMVEAAVSEGLHRSDAVLLAEQTMLGTARLLIESEMSPLELIRSVSSPNGTTVAGMACLDQPSFAARVQETVEAAARRSKELRG